MNWSLRCAKGMNTYKMAMAWNKIHGLFPSFRQINQIPWLLQGWEELFCIFLFLNSRTAGNPEWRTTFPLFVSVYRIFISQIVLYFLHSTLVFLFYTFYWDFYVQCYPFWPTHLGYLKLGSFGSATSRLPGCFCPWTLSLNIGFDILPSDSLMSCLDSLLW